MNIIKSLIFPTIVILFIAGCSSKPPGCSDEKTTALTSRIFIGELAAGIGETAEKLGQIVSTSVSKVRTLDSDEKSNIVRCEGILNVQLPAGAAKIIGDSLYAENWQKKFNMQIVEGGRATISTNIEYTSRMTNDKKDHIVGLRGHENLVLSFERLTLNGAYSIFNTKLGVDNNVSKHEVGSKILTGATILGLECGDMCHLEYRDHSGKSHSALCGDGKLCRKWADDPQAFKHVVGSMATLTIGKEFIPEANSSIDSITAITITKASNTP